MKLKKILNVFRAASGTADKHFTSAIIAAAGLSTRFGENKQSVSILNVPVLIHTLRAYDASDCIDEIIIVTKKEDIELWREQCELFSIKKVTKIIEGGSTRQESVLRGFEAISDKAKFVAIADGARCLTTPTNINDVCFAAYDYKAATAAHRATDTVKIARSGRFIESTPDRDTIWMAQTPQVFKVSLYRAAVYTALQEKITVTDDNSLVEFIGHPIYLVECGAQNLKITTQEDIAIADGARCLITPMNINDVCFAAYKHKAATAAHRATDTVKVARSGRFIESSPDRDTVWAAQTPQVFKANLYRAAAYTALKEGVEATDDNSLVEFIGHPIYLVECGAQNIKITTKDDIIIAQSILQARKDEAIAKERKELGL